MLFHLIVDTAKRNKKTQKNVNELSGSLGSSFYHHQHSYTYTLYVFGLDAVEKTIKTEKNVNELSGPGEVTQVRVVVRATA